MASRSAGRRQAAAGRQSSHLLDVGELSLHEMCQALPNERYAVDLAHLVAQLEAGCVRVMVKVCDHVLVREADAKRAILAPVHVYLHEPRAV